MYDAVIFVDHNLRIIGWNRAAERLTGIAAASVIDHAWSPTLIKMREEQAGPTSRIECPIAHSIATGVQSLRRLLVANRAHLAVAVDVHTVPVIGPNGVTLGATMLLHDVSPEARLEERCQNLHERATKDPLTQVANRAEFDRAAPVVRRRALGDEPAVQHDHVRHRPLQIDQRHARPPDRRRSAEDGRSFAG